MAWSQAGGPVTRRGLAEAVMPVLLAAGDGTAVAGSGQGRTRAGASLRDDAEASPWTGSGHGKVRQLEGGQAQ